MSDLAAVLGRDVSRETQERLTTYADLLRQWNSRINLVSQATIADLWTRHMLDSAQVFALKPGRAKSWTDLGTGGGFPGLVVAILAAEIDPALSVTIIESDARKCAFLRSVLARTGVAAAVRAERVEASAPVSSDVVSARALAPLPDLLALVARHLGPGGAALLPKGARWQGEVEAARKTWRFTCEVHRSKTDPDAVILQIGDLSHV